MLRSLKKLGIRSWMLFGTTLATLPLLGFATWIVVALISKQHTEDDQQLLQRSQAASLALQHRFDRATAALEALAASPSLQQGDFHALYDEARAVIKRHPDASAISIVRADGEQMFSTAVPWGSKLPPSQAIKFEGPVFDKGEVVYTPMYFGSLTHQWVMAVSVPGRVDGKVAYSLRMGIPSGALSAVLKEQVLPPDWTAAVIDPTGVIGGRSSDAARLVGQLAAQSLREAISKSSPCPYVATTTEGTQVSSCFVRIQQAGWLAAIGVPTGAYERDLRDSLFKLLVAGAASLAVGLFGAFLIANAIKRQVAALAAASLPSRRGFGDSEGSSPTIRELADAVQGIQASRRRAGELESLLARAKHDSLTGLPGRELFHELVAADIASVSPETERAAVLYLDLDGFKAINDTQGHDAGDVLLSQVAETIRSVVRANDIPGRVGGDEFIIFLRAAAPEVERAAQYVAERMQARIRLLGEIGCSIGIAIGACDASLLDELITEADQAMFRAKASGKGRHVFSKP